MLRVVMPKLLQIAMIVTLVIGIASCDNLFGADDEEDGTITVTFSDDADSAEEGNFLSAVVFPEGGDFPDGEVDVLGGVLDLEIQDGDASETLKEWDSDKGQPTTETMTFSAGDTVDFYAWTTNEPDYGPDKPYFKASFTIDGDRTIEVSAEDFAE